MVTVDFINSGQCRNGESSGAERVCKCPRLGVKPGQPLRGLRPLNMGRPSHPPHIATLPCATLVFFSVHSIFYAMKSHYFRSYLLCLYFSYRICYWQLENWQFSSFPNNCVGHNISVLENLIIGLIFYSNTVMFWETKFVFLYNLKDNQKQQK